MYYSHAMVVTFLCYDIIIVLWLWHDGGSAVFSCYYCFLLCYYVIIVSLLCYYCGDVLLCLCYHGGDVLFLCYLCVNICVIM